VGYELDVTDCFGHRVRLDHVNWERHLPRHAELAPYHGQIPLVLREPHAVVQSAADGALHFYRLGIGEGMYQPLYLHIIVDCAPTGDCWVKTCYFTGAIDVDGEVLRFQPPG